MRRRLRRCAGKARLSRPASRSRPATWGAVAGVIGGYEQGGDTPSVSYSARFGQAVRDLYNKAVSRN